MHRLGLAALLAIGAACGGSATPLRATPNVAPPSEVAPAAAVRSPPRADWPCRIDVRAFDAVTWTFEYRGPAACWLPIELFGHGILGCPSAIVIDNPAARYHGREELRYDDTGHLVERKPAPDRSFTWEGDQLVQGTWRYVVHDRVVDAVLDDKPELHMNVDRASRPTQIEYFNHGEVTGRATLRWSGTRLIGVETVSLVTRGDVTHVTPVYDCNP